MRAINIIPANTRIDFMRWRWIACTGSLILCLLSVGLLLTRGLNYGIDFEGGILLDIRTEGPANLADLRDRLSNLGLGEAQLQEFGSESGVLIRLPRQAGGEEEQRAAIQKVQDALGPGVEYRRIEFVGPQIGDELIEASAIALLLSLVGIMIYVWFRFEWQFGVGAVVALFHDALLTVGIFSMLQLQFDLTTVAALLTIIGYSVNDTVVIFDRVRENLRKYKKMELVDLLNLSLNDTLSRTILTSSTVFLAVLMLLLFGGDVIWGFSFAMLWGVIVGCYSTVFVASAIVLFTKFDRGALAPDEEEETGRAKAR